LNKVFYTAVVSVHSVPEKTDSEPVLLRRSTRRRKPPDRYGFNVA